jgi:magnesium-transporting ATPase (P-type)
MFSNLQRSPQPRTTTPKGHSIRVSPILTELAHLEKSEVFTRLKTSQDGLTQSEAQERLIEHGPNIVASEKQRGWMWRLFTASRNLLVILLTTLGIVSFATGDFRARRRNDADGDPRRGATICAGGACGCSGCKTQSDDQCHCSSGTRRRDEGNPAYAVGSRRYRKVVRR